MRAPGFIDRDRELHSLADRYASDRAELYVLYGRRRVGKTELLRAFCADKAHVFFVADLSTESAALAEFTRQISAAIYGRDDALGPFSSWEQALEFLGGRASHERLVVVLDEFTYLIRANPALPSILQRLWDTRLAQTQLMLILCGSYVGMMEQQVLSYRSPLYGRRSGQWKLQPLTFADAALFFPRYAAADRVRAYAILGGIPAYLLQLDQRSTLLDNVEARILATGTFLYEEPRFLLLQELGEPQRYFSVLHAIAAGRTRLNEIAQGSGVAIQSLPFYLSTLRELELVERTVPATERNPDKSRRGIYRLRDNYFRFWFRFVYPNRSLLERGQRGQARVLVEQHLEHFTGAAFEDVCREYVWRLHERGKSPFPARSSGSWWDDQEQIDVVSVGETEILLGECKWTSRPVGANILDDLKRKAQSLLRQGRWARVHYALFARSGFTPALEQVAADEGVLLIDLATLTT